MNYARAPHACISLDYKRQHSNQIGSLFNIAAVNLINVANIVTLSGLNLMTRNDISNQN